MLCGLLTTPQGRALKVSISEEEPGLIGAPTVRPQVTVSPIEGAGLALRSV